ncbi:hypothetical protein HYW94_04215 [Candidatus Uhrbacteria bacterium]|nr:hypothetical protein [Candidatus Uhrbacteria bacterium]
MSRKREFSLITFTAILSAVSIGFIFFPNVVYAKHTDYRIDGEDVREGRIEASSVIVQKITSQTAMITWNTSQPAKTWLQYGETIAFGNEYKNDALTKEHQVYLRNLKSGTLYPYTVLIEDGKGVQRYHRRMEGMKMINFHSSPSFTTLTKEQEAQEARKKSEAMMEGKATLTFRFYGDTIERGWMWRLLFQDTQAFDFSAPRITAMSIKGDSHQATLSWTTDADMTEAYIDYGRDTSYGFWKEVDCAEEQCRRVHSVVLDGLIPGSDIHFRMRMRGRYNEEKTSSGYAIIETPDLVFTVPPSSSQISDMSLHQQDITTPNITAIKIKKIVEENRKAFLNFSSSMTQSYYDIPKRVDITVYTDEPSTASIELLHLIPGTYGAADIEKAETLISEKLSTNAVLSFYPKIDALRDYAYQVTVKDGVGNQYTSRYFTMNVRGALHITESQIMPQKNGILPPPLTANQIPFMTSFLGTQQQNIGFIPKQMQTQTVKKEEVKKKAKKKTKKIVKNPVKRVKTSGKT